MTLILCAIAYGLSVLIAIPLIFRWITNGIQLTNTEDLVIAGAGAVVFGLLWPLYAVLASLIPAFYLAGKLLDRMVNR
jgi:hypothetical protein